MLNEAIKMAKGSDEEKAMTSVSMPKSLKDDLVGIANGNNVSTNALIVSLLTIAVNSGNITENSIHGKDLISELQRLEERRIYLTRIIDEIGGVFDTDSENEKKILDDLQSAESTIATLKGVLS